EVVARRVRRAWRRVVRAGEGLDAGSPAPELHALRIRAKQLRYVLDATAPIHEPEPHERLVESLKRLQAALGECNDVSVQRGLLDELAAEIGQGGGAAATLLAVGRLQARLDEREARGRADLAGLVERLSGGRVRDAVRRLTRPADGTAA
ncbi:MAG TPA: CHAD domain-containing protein, partial [Planctomycetota bacterium]|nr:CHAD domain-containing protein [Planctomycetota bacterium]